MGSAWTLDLAYVVQVKYRDDEFSFMAYDRQILMRHECIGFPLWPRSLKSIRRQCFPLFMESHAIDVPTLFRCGKIHSHSLVYFILLIEVLSNLSSVALRPSREGVEQQATPCQEIMPLLM
jgi:hypothetical protein